MFSDKPFSSYSLLPDPGSWATSTGPDWVCSKYHCPIWDTERETCAVHWTSGTWL